MDAFLGPVVGKLVEKLVDKLANSISKPLDYIVNCRSNFKSLEEQLGELQRIERQIKLSVDRAENSGEEIEQHVKVWQLEVNEMIKDVTNIVEENKKDEMKCFKNLCPDLKKRYRLSKNAVEKAKDVSGFRAKEDLTQISHRRIPQGKGHLSTEFMEDCKSRMSTLNDVISALEHANMVGICGMGGVGKTTLAKKVGETVRGKLFDFVVFVEVTEQPNVEEIRNTIADMLNLNLQKNKVLSARAAELYEMLEKKRKVLIILDNLWKTIDLKEVGIPLADGDKGCHLLLTTRDKNILMQMDCRKEFPIEALGKEDSWKLFAETAGSCVHDIKVASNVAERCGGLPVAIVTVAKALKDKPINVWEAALREFQQYPEGSVIEKAHSCIQLSYKHLNPDGLKPIFLLCCMLSSITKPSIENLLRYGLVLNIFEPAETMEDQRDNIRKVIRELVGRSLLLESSDDEFFSIHDVVREIGARIRIIAPEEECLVVNNILRPSIQRSLLQNLTWIFLIDMAKLPNKLNCPKLTFLYLKTKSRFPMAQDFFSGMSKLEAIHLEGLDLSKLPKSLSSLVELGALCLKNCILEDTSVIGEFKNLEILVLSDTRSKKMVLLESVGNLCWLRLLDVRGSSFFIPSKIISRLTLLEELYMDEWYDPQWVEGLNIESSVASLKELKEMGRLTALQVRVADADIKVFSESVVFQNLKRYNIVIGVDFFAIDSSRSLKVVSNTNICLEGVIKQLKGIENLMLDGKHIIKNTLSELDEEGFPRLKELALWHLVNLEKICHDQVGPQCFCQLRRIQISGCHKLKNLLPLSIAKQLILENIVVQDCENIEHIFTVDRAEDGAIDPISVKNLDSLSLIMLPKLSGLCSEMEVTLNASLHGDVPESQLNSPPLFEEKIVFPNLTRLVLVSVNLRRILPSLVQNLTEMVIRDCKNLKHIFSSSTLSSVKNLRDLSISGCEALEVVVRIDDDNCMRIEFPSLDSLKIESCTRLRELIARRCIVEEIVEGGVIEGSAKMFSFPQLTFLSLRSLPELGYFYRGEYIAAWQKLKKLEVLNCQKLVDLFDFQKHDAVDCASGRPPSSIHQKFPLLEDLALNPKQLGTIRWSSFADSKHFFPRLQCLDVHIYSDLEFLPHDCLEKFHLEKLRMHGCLNEEIFSCREVEKEDGAYALLTELKVSSCDKLKILMPPQSLAFRNLKILEVNFCSEMMSVISVSTAKCLIVLEEMRITSCEKVAQIIREEGGLGGEIIMHKLKTLELRGLENLMNFYSGNYTFNFPLLEQITISNCPSLKFFSSGVFTMPKLQQVKKNRTSHSCKDNELNELIGDNKKATTSPEDRAGSSTPFIFPTKTLFYCKLFGFVIMLGFVLIVAHKFGFC